MTWVGLALLLLLLEELGSRRIVTVTIWLPTNARKFPLDCIQEWFAVCAREIFWPRFTDDSKSCGNLKRFRESKPPDSKPISA